MAHQFSSTVSRSKGTLHRNCESQQPRCGAGLAVVSNKHGRGRPAETKGKLFLWEVERFFSLCSSKNWLSGPYQMNQSIKRHQTKWYCSAPTRLAFP